MDVDMETELAWLREDFIADDTNASPILCHAATDMTESIHFARNVSTFTVPPMSKEKKRL
jgi:hypothetical protein